MSEPVAATFTRGTIPGGNPGVAELCAHNIRAQSLEQEPRDLRRSAEELGLMGAL